MLKRDLELLSVMPDGGSSRLGVEVC